MNIRELLDLLKALLVGNRALKAAPRWSVEQMREWQLARIRDLVTDAYHNVPFYSELYRSVAFEPGDLKGWDDFRCLPLVSKEQVIANYPHKMLRKGMKPDDLIVSRSSGSSGKVLDIAYDGQAFTTYILAGLRLFNMGFGYRPWHRQSYIYTSPYPMDSLFGLFPLHHIPTLTPIPVALERLMAAPPDLLVCYPSHLKQIAHAMGAAERRRINPKLISVNSEMSTQAERDELSRFFGCPVLDEYSSEELTRIAAQCRHKAYHIFEDINYLETLDDKGLPATGLGLLVGTNLHNRAMPMIRYQQNDLGELAPSSCGCGWHFRELRNLQGRRNDSFVMPSGKVLTSGFLLDVTYEFLLDDRTAILDFCLIQKAAASILLEIVPGQGWQESVAVRIREKFSQFLEPGVELLVQTVGECTKTRTGKRNPIINQTNRGSQA
jgi:phenylacetate-CoA ligase